MAIVNFVENFVSYAEESQKPEAKRIALKLRNAGLDSFSKLVETNDVYISNIKGIGPRSMHIIGEVKTKIEYDMKNQKETYKKMCGNIVTKDLKYYIQKCGKSYLEACTIDHILKANGIRDMEVFRNTPIDNFKYFNKIGPKRMETLAAVMKLANADYKRVNRKSQSK